MCEFFYQERKDHSLTSRQEPPVNYGHYKVFVLTMVYFFLFILGAAENLENTMTAYQQ